MKHLFLLSFILFFFNSLNAQKKTITIQCTQTSDYCGGVRPTEEMMEELQKASPIANTVFYIVKGNTHRYTFYKKVKTNEKGIIKTILPNGAYTIFSEEQMAQFRTKQNTEYEAWDNNCLLQLHKQPLLKINTKTKKTWQFNMHKKCFYSLPCLNYTGPLPA